MVDGEERREVVGVFGSELEIVDGRNKEIGCEVG